MEYIQSLLDSTTTPLIAAFLLGILTAISPCPLATNITAVGYIGKEIENPRSALWRGILYTFGRVFTYTLLGALLIFFLKGGMSIFGIQKSVAEHGERLLPIVLLLVGVLILFADKIKLPSVGYKFDEKAIKSRGGFEAFLLGVLFSLAFCPTSGVFFFGMLIPMSVNATAGYLLPLVYAIATGLPVIIAAWILAYSVGSIGSFYGKVKTFQKWLNAIAGLLCIAVGIYYAFTIYL